MLDEDFEDFYFQNEKFSGSAQSCWLLIQGIKSVLLIFLIPHSFENIILT